MRKPKRNDVAQRPLVPCPSCGKTHRQGSLRSRECNDATRSGHGFATVQGTSMDGPTFSNGELSRTGGGDKPQGLPMPHAVFSAQILPNDIIAAAQPRHDLIPTTRDESKRLVATLRAAARSAVKEWRRRGIEPTQQMMFDMDVYVDEVHELEMLHAEALRVAAESLRSRGVTIPADANTDRARKQCFHAIQTVKGLALSPINVQRIIARAAPGQPYDARDLTRFAIGLRAIADSDSEIRAILAKDYQETTGEDLQPIVSMVRNYGALAAGRVRIDEAGRTVSEVTGETLANFGPEAARETDEALRRIESEAKRLTGQDVALKRGESHGDLLALPVDIAGDLAGNELSYADWRRHGWDFGRSEVMPQMVLLEPVLVKARMRGNADETIMALRPEIARDDPNYHYSPSVFLKGTGYYAVGGCSSVGGEQFGFSEYQEQSANIQRLFLERNIGRRLAYVSGF